MGGAEQCGPVSISGNLYIGYSAPNAVMLITNGATLHNAQGTIGLKPASANSLAVVAGSGSMWINRNQLYIGNSGNGCQLVVSNGATVAAAGTFIGYNATGSRLEVTGEGSRCVINGQLLVSYWSGDDQVVVSDGGGLVSSSCVFSWKSGANNSSAIVTGTGSSWTNNGTLTLGYGGSGHTLYVTNNGTVVSGEGVVGFAGDDDVALVGAGGSWMCSAGLFVGSYGSGNSLVLQAGGLVASGGATILGEYLGSANNILQLDGGTLNVGTTLDVRRGTLQLDSGTATMGTLLATNGADSTIVFNGGTLTVNNSTVDNGATLLVGDGSSLATYQLTGSGLHTFNNGLIITNNAQLIGNGTLSGTLTVQPGGSIAPGTSVGLLVLSNSPVLQGNVVMEISKNGSTLTNNQIQVGGPLTYGGTLTVSNVGPTALAAGDSFQLFTATSYSGAFAATNLPALVAGLKWSVPLTNGTLTVVASSSPSISSVTVTGTDLVFNVTEGSPGGAYDVLTSTNVALPLSSWTTSSSGTFDGSGNAAITNSIDFTEPQRFFTISVP